MGIFDSSFGDDGRMLTDFGRDRDATVGIATTVGIQNDGKIIAAGTTTRIGHEDAQTWFAIARYNADGRIDSTFSGDGKQITEFIDIQAGFVSSLAIQQDGKIIVVGKRWFGGVIIRYATDGSVDMIVDDYDDGFDSERLSIVEDIKAVTLQSDGKIVVAGSSLARYKTDGRLDSTFGSDGVQATTFDISAVSIQKDGKIVVGGQGLARYRSDGSPDNTFSQDGLQSIGFHANSLVIQGNGKIVLAGYETIAISKDATIGRYNADGSLDNAFGKKGRLSYSIHNGNAIYTGTAIQKDGKAVTIGRTWNGSNFDFCIARYKSDGTLDSTFNGNGIQTTDFGGNDYAATLAIQKDGKIVVAGHVNRGAFRDNDFAIARYNTDGSLDNNFSKNGKQTADFDSSVKHRAICPNSKGWQNSRFSISSIFRWL